MRRGELSGLHGGQRASPTRGLLHASALIHHDWLILRNSVADLFTSWRDRALLGFGIVIAVAWLVQNFGQPTSPIEPRVVALLTAIAAFAAFATYRGSARRLCWFAEHSILCAEALDPKGCRAYHLHWQALITLGVVLVVAVVHGRAADNVFSLLAAGMVAQMMGMLAAMLLTRLQGEARAALRRHEVSEGSSSHRALSPSSSGRWWSIIIRKQVPFIRSPRGALAVTVATGVVVMALATTFNTGNNPGSWALLGILTGGGMLLLVRMDEQIVRFSAFVGVGAWESAAAYWVAPAAFASGGMAASSVAAVASGGNPVPQLLAVTIATFAVLFIATVRVWQCRLMPLAAADRVLSLDAAACLILGLSFWPLALGWGGFRLARLYRYTRAATWSAS